MALVEMVMPKMGESIMEGTILSWLKKVGDTIEQDESVLEVATDKVDTEVPSTHAGVLKEILANEGDVVEVGKPIAVIATDGADVPAPSRPEPEVVEKAEALVAEAVEAHSASASAAAPVLEKPTSGRFYSPLVLNIAREESIPMTELESLPGTGKEGRVTKKDILAYVKTRKSNGAPVPAEAPTASNGVAPAKAASQPVAVSFSGEDEIIEMDRMRKMIAERMVSSKQTSPHVTSFVEADVTEVVKWRGKHKKAFMEKEGQALTFTPIFIEAVVNAIKDYPMINVQVDGNKIIKKGSINVGMAVALPSGNLIVPVIHNADQLSLKGIALKVNDLARRGRDNKLKPDDLSGGTYTVSNVGSFGNVMGTPIIMQPQVGILALGAIVKKPSVIETPQGDLIGIRHKMFLSHSYDHRVVDGALGGMFVRRVADYLEKFDPNRTI
ncbi:MAG: dihydrolipoamide acetyltransferase family protein [Reichenbachiella sp.]|uniref:dihydrolipoamide acetyltransferase family protein n=1 Tax=Reichenbachiella sp. TaxID=2184521 RepID=UPI003298B949